MRRVLIIAGGTGGHIFPGLCIAKALEQQHIEIFWLGSEIGLEKELVNGKYPLYFIPAKRVRGKKLINQLQAPFTLIRAIWKSWRLIRRLQPDVILAMGGFACAPGGIAAKISKKPLVIHEQNSIPGYANRLLSYFANEILVSFPETFKKNRNVKMVGNPVRLDLFSLPPPSCRYKEEDAHFNILILGGSQGASAINHLITSMLNTFPTPQQLRIWHQTGTAQYDQVRESYQKLDVVAKVNSFIDDIASAYGWADLVICRSGALTVAEIAAVGVASILIPFPYAVDDHQWHNGQFLAEKEAAILMREEKISVEVLADLIIELMSNRDRLLRMAEKAKELGKPESVQSVITALNEVIGKN